MTNTANLNRHPIEPQGQVPAAEGDLEELRQLLLKPEQEQLQQLGERLDDPVLHAQEISEVLSEAMLLSAKRDGKLATALTPTVEEIVRLSVRNDIRTFADALFPIIGPAIRKAIFETLKQMIQSLNQTLDRSLSWQGLRWRLESIRTGKPFAEIVLLHSLVYRVEQVFLIHCETGVLLQHVSNATETFQDADLVSGMLSAIQDFVRDSFDFTTAHTLNSIQIGDFSVWIEQGPDLVIAGAIRGSAPEQLRLAFHNALENIHLEQREALANFDGDVTPFELARHNLESCLQTRFRDKPRTFSPLLAIGLLTVISIAGLWAFDSFRDHRRWIDYLERIESEPGIIVTGTRKKDGKYQVSGLQDPLARNPAEILASTSLDPERVILLFRPYQALSSNLVLERARRILAPPVTVVLNFENGLLRVSGQAPYQWIADTLKLSRMLPGVLQVDATDLQTEIDFSPLNAPDSIDLTLRDGLLIAAGSAPHVWIEGARDKALAIPGIAHYDDTQVKIEPDLSLLRAPDSVTLGLQNGVLTTTGNASHAWIAMAREQAPRIPGIARYDDNGLLDTDLASLMSLKSIIEQEVVLFDIDSASYAGEKNHLERILSDVVRIIDLAPVVGRHAFVQIVGHSDSSGGHQQNLSLSLTRAEVVREYFVANGIKPDTITAIGVGTDDPVRVEELSKQDKRMNRSVTFRIRLTDSADETK